MIYKYNIATGIKRIRTKTALAISGAALGIAGLLMAVAMPLAAKAVTPTYTITPWTFVGAAGDCGTGYPAGTGPVVSKWDYTTGNPSPSLLLQKNAPTADCSSAGATVNGVNGITLTELNFDYNNAGHCGAGAPRYNVVTTDNVTHFFGCLYGIHSPAATGWTHVEYTPADGLPAVTSGEVVQSIDVVFDEGTDIIGQGTPGSVNLDNFSINGQVIGGPNTPASKDACKNGGWKNLQDSNGTSFKNQGDCVSFSATNGKNLGNG